MVSAGVRILAVDDQPSFRRFLEGLLGESGHDAVVCSSAEVTGACEESSFDLVLFGGEDLDAFAQLRARLPGVPMLTLVASGAVARAVAFMRAGACDCLSRPLDGAELLRRLAQAHASGRSARAPGEAPPGEAPEDLADENLRLLDQISRYERVLALFSELELERVVHGIVELLAVEVAASAGELWLPRGDREEYACAGRWSLTPESDAPGSVPLALRELEEARWDRAASGEVSALVPLGGAAERLGAARITGLSPTICGPAELEGLRELADWVSPALQWALHCESLRDEGLLDARTQLPSSGFFVRALQLEIHKAQRFGRKLCVVCVELHGEKGRPLDSEILEPVVHALARTLRDTDLLATEDGGRFSILVTDTDQLGGVVLKRRLADRVREALAGLGSRSSVSLGVSNYPLDGESVDVLVEAALARARFEKRSVIHELGFQEDAPLAAIGERLLRLAHRTPERTLSEIAEFLISELATRPNDSGLLFLAPGEDPAPVVGPLMALGDSETSTEVFLATDGDTVPASAALTAVALPPGFDTRTTWIVRFGEGPPYALVAGAVSGDGTRPIYHSTDPVLVEQMTFRLCAELGVGVRT